MHQIMMKRVFFYIYCLCLLHVYASDLPIRFDGKNVEQAIESAYHQVGLMEFSSTSVKRALFLKNLDEMIPEAFVNDLWVDVMWWYDLASLNKNETIFKNLILKNKNIGRVDPMVNDNIMTLRLTELSNHNLWKMTSSDAKLFENIPNSYVDGLKKDIVEDVYSLANQKTFDLNKVLSVMTYDPDLGFVYNPSGKKMSPMEVLKTYYSHVEKQISQYISNPTDEKS